MPHNRNNNTETSRKLTSIPESIQTWSSTTFTDWVISAGRTSRGPPSAESKHISILSDQYKKIPHTCTSNPTLYIPIHNAWDMRDLHLVNESHPTIRPLIWSSARSLDNLYGGMLTDKARKLNGVRNITPLCVNRNSKQYKSESMCMYIHIYNVCLQWKRWKNRTCLILSTAM